jgi:hypothetical protein
MARKVLQVASGDRVVILYGKSQNQILTDLRWIKKDRKNWGSRDKMAFPREYGKRFAAGSRGLGKYVDEEGNNVFYFGINTKDIQCHTANGIARETIQTFCLRSGLRSTLSEVIGLFNQDPIQYLTSDSE